MAGSIMDMISQHKVLVACAVIAVAVILYMYYRKRNPTSAKPCVPTPAAAPVAGPSASNADTTGTQVAEKISAIASNAAQVSALATQAAKDNQQPPAPGVVTGDATSANAKA